MNGVDISHYQHGLTIQHIKDAGNQFAIIKLTEGTWLVDKSSFDFYREAYELGFPVGCYCYSHAINAQQAMAEAAYLMDVLRGFPMPCGVFLDIEEPKQLDLSHDDLLNVIRGWCAGIGGKGYIPGIYASEGNLWSKISPDELPDGCLVWVAKWSSNPPGIRCDLWQTSDSGRIEGYSSNVDTDAAISDYFKALVSRGFPNKESGSEAPATGGDVAAPTTPNSDAGIKAAVMVIQLVMAYAGCWGDVTGERSPEFFDALRTFTDDLEKAK